MIEHELTIILAEQLADFITTYVICYNLDEGMLRTLVDKKSICFTESQSETSARVNSKIYIRKISRTRFNFNFEFNNDKMSEREFYNRLYIIVNGYTNLDISRRGSWGDFLIVNFSLDFGGKANSELFFKNIKVPSKQDFGSMIL